MKARDELRAENPAAGTWSALIQRRVSTLGKYQARHKSRAKNPATPEGMVSPNPPSHSLGRSDSRSRRANLRKNPRLLHMDRPCREGVWPPPSLLVVFPNKTLYSPLVRQLDPCGWQRNPGRWQLHSDRGQLGALWLASGVGQLAGGSRHVTAGFLQPGTAHCLSESISSAWQLCRVR